MLFDLFLVLFLAGQLFLFARGLPLGSDPLVSASLVAFSLTGFAAYQGALLPGVLLPFQGIVFAFQLLGLIRLWTNPPQIHKCLRAHWVVLAVTGAALVFWLWMMRDIDGLVSYHDGMAHTTYLLRMVENGRPLIHQNANSLAAEFAEGVFRFYPGGTHALVAMFNGWAIGLKWVTASEVLKAWTILMTAFSPALAYWVSRRFFPKAAAPVSWIVLAAALTYYRYPLWQVPSGGFSRQLALFVVLPIVAQLLRGGVSDKLLRYLFIVGPVAAFLLHPGVFALVEITLFWVWWHTPKTPRKRATDLLCAAGGLAFVLWMVRSTGSDTHIVEKFPALSASRLWDQLRVIVLLIPAIFDDFSNAAVAPLSGRELLDYAGLATLCLGGLPWALSSRVRWYPFFLFAAVSAMLLLALVPVATLQLIPQLFYNHAERAAEIFYLAQILIWAAGAIWFWEQRKNRWGKWGFRLLLLLLATDTFKTVRFYIPHMQQMVVSFQSPTHSGMGEMVKLVRERTEPEALIVIEPFLLDSTEHRTWRKALFLFSECPEGSLGANCEARKRFYSEWRAVLAAASASPDAARKCMGFSASIKRPLYVVVRESEVPKHPLCRDLTTVGNAGGLVLLKRTW